MRPTGRRHTPQHRWAKRDRVAAQEQPGWTHTSPALPKRAIPRRGRCCLEWGVPRAASGRAALPCVVWTMPSRASANSALVYSSGISPAIRRGAPADADAWSCTMARFIHTRSRQSQGSIYDSQVGVEHSSPTPSDGGPPCTPITAPQISSEAVRARDPIQVRSLDSSACPKGSPLASPDPGLAFPLASLISDRIRTQLTVVL